MKYEAMKTKFKGVFIKKPRSGEENSIGYNSDSHSQLYFKSEINKYNRIGSCINGSLYVIPSDLMKQLKDHVANNSSSLPIEVTYKEERYIIPVSLLQLFGSDSTPEPTLKQFVGQNENVFQENMQSRLEEATLRFSGETETILTKAQQVIEDCKIMSSLPFYKTLFIQENLLVTSIENQVSNLHYNVTEEKVINAIVSLVILNEINKN